MRRIEEDRGEGCIVLDYEHERLLAQLVAVVVDLERRRQRSGDDGPAIVVTSLIRSPGGGCVNFGFDRNVEGEG